MYVKTIAFESVTLKQKSEVPWFRAFHWCCCNWQWTVKSTISENKEAILGPATY